MKTNFLKIRSQIVYLLLAWCASSLGYGSQVENTGLQPPVAKVIPQRLEKHGQVRVDNYFWLKERNNPEVVRYLKAENDYVDKVMAHTQGLQDMLFKEFKERIKQTDLSVPYQHEGYYYYTRVEADKQYPLYCRKKGSLEALEEIYLDVNVVAKGLKYCSIASPTISSDGNQLVYGLDTAGRLFYTLKFRNLKTQQDYSESISNVTASVAWANDHRTLFYSRQDPVTLRPYQIWRHSLGSNPALDTLVYEEKDSTFGCGVGKLKSKRYLVIVSYQTLSTEWRILDADQPFGEFKVVQPRERDHEYWLDHYGDYFYIRTNLKAKNFRLMRTPVGQAGTNHWEEVIPHRPDVLLEGLELFKDYLVTVERREGLLRLFIKPWSGGGEHYVEFGEPAYAASLSANFELNTPLLRYEYSSMTTPRSVYDYHMGTGARTLLKQDEVLAGFKQDNYRTERIYATAPDGLAIPISLVYHRQHFATNGSNPLLLYGYGSYGYTQDASFDAMRVSLLDRGFVYAIAHIRGGSEMGRAWYEEGKLLKKKNTFTDFIACADHLVARKYADPQNLFARGGSAGGLLMGAVINLRPTLFKGIIADVPWVDVVTGMLDDTIPLTTVEYDEWGNPNDQQYYDYMLSYSPYDQVTAQAYPNILAMTSFQDSQVQYWDPAKWVAKLRVLKTSPSLILLKTEMEASHGGLSSRDDRYRQTAFRYAFLIDLASGTKITNGTPKPASGLDKKLIEYGWDVPTPAQMNDELAIMETRPFDGLIFRLSAGHNAFVTKPLEATQFAEDASILRKLPFNRFKNNFVLVWGSPPADFDWFDDTQWTAIEDNAKLLVEIGLAGRIRGICFDPEPYDFSLWHHAKQPHAKDRAFTEYQAKVRQRGTQLMRAFEQKMPGALILTFFHVSLYDRFAAFSEEERIKRLEHESWGLMPDFFIGMLEGASPQARFIDGNENAYYYTSREQYFRAYHAIRQRARALIPAELRDKYDRQVQAGQALYVDQNFALRQPKKDQYLSYRMTPEEQARWFEHNTYWALYTTDEYVWCYSERMNWWKSQTPTGLESAILSARKKYHEGKPLGFDIEPLIDAVQKR